MFRMQENDNDQNEGPLVDRDVSRNYRALASERSPDALDRLVLDDARTALLAERAGRWRRLMTPAALAAGVLLTVAFIVDFDVPQPPADGGTPTVAPGSPPPAAGFRIGDVERADAGVDAAAAGHCADLDTQTPDTWLRCIAALEDAGDAAAAAAERKRLGETFPDAATRP